MEFKPRSRRVLLAVALAVVAVLLTVFLPSVLAAVSSSFDTDTEGWNAVGDPTAPPQWIAGGGNPGGFIRVTDRGAGTTMYWDAPAAFTGDKSVYYGGSLGFDLRQSTTANQFNDNDVMLAGGGVTLAFDTPDNPGTDWTHYEVPLYETGWTVLGSSTAATPAQMQAVLASVTSLQIRAEFANGPDTDDLDNVKLTEVVPPVAGKTAAASVVSGTVLVKPPAGKHVSRAAAATPAANGFVSLKGTQTIPIGSTVDTRHGRVGITAAANLKNRVQRAEFYEGVFALKQKRTSKPVTEAVLTTSVTKGCGGGVARASSKKHHVVSHLWANGKGNFRTRGHNSSATVRGTIWLTEDRCDGTLTTVRRGSVKVRDLRTQRTVIVKAGHSYLARARSH